jgi:hypothetical protein
MIEHFLKPLVHALSPFLSYATLGARERHDPDILRRKLNSSRPAFKTMPERALTGKQIAV